MTNIPFSFEAAAHNHEPIEDGFIDNALDGKLPYGEYFLKSFFDLRDADQSDIEFGTTPDAVVAFRNELSDFIGNNLALFHARPIAPDVRRYIGHRLGAFKEKIAGDKQTVETFIRERARGESPASPHSAYEYHGLTFKVASGSVIDILESGVVEGVRSNITLQRELAGMFVHYASEGYLKQRLQDNNPSLEKRIYLNPRSTDAVRIFQALIQGAEAAGLSFKGKILDKSYDSVYLSSSLLKRGGVRGDAIVLYSSADEADDLLQVVKSVYLQNEPSFAGRFVSRIPRMIAPGIAVGDEPIDAPDASLTSHRAGVFQSVIDDVRSYERKNPSVDRKKVFRELWRRAAIEANIDPDNPAFNLSQ